MKVVEESCLAKGVVSPSFVDVRTGKKSPFDTRHNTLSYMSAEAMAAAFGGDPSFIPAKIGFIYGSEQTMPMDEAISRVQDWKTLSDDIGAARQGSSIDVQIVDFSYSPTLGKGKQASDSSGSGSSSPSGSGIDNDNKYCHILSTGSNAITFHAVSNSQDLGFFGSDPFLDGSYIYQCLLLGYHNGEYYIIARASLKDNGNYLQKPSGFEVALDWTITFR